MNRPKLLDLFCGAGGAGMGYHRAGFDVVGVDIAPQRHYPFEFVQGDALDYVASCGHMFDAIHASPRCQIHSQITPDKSKHVDMIPATREALERLRKPYVIENVYGALKSMRSPIMLCGSQFGLKVYRHRLFESNVMLFMPNHVPHHDNTPRAGHGISDKGFISVTSGGKTVDIGKAAKWLNEKGYMTVVGHFGGADYARFAMGIEWMNARELAQAIPPAYTEYIGRQLMPFVERTTNEVKYAV
jgi:DNA (cytosine-5)-methyltransferase 1